MNYKNKYLKYKKKYLNSQKGGDISQTQQFLHLHEESMSILHDKVISLIPTEKLSPITKEEFITRLKKLNEFLDIIFTSIQNLPKEEAIKKIKEFTKMKSSVASIIYGLYLLINDNIHKIPNNKSEFISIDTSPVPTLRVQPQIVGGGICDVLILLSDMGGMIPVAGMAIDAAGVVLSLVCGDYVGAALGVVSIIPGLGMLSGGIEIARGVYKMYSLTSKDDEDEDEDEDEDD